MRDGPPQVKKDPPAEAAPCDAMAGRDFIAENLRALFANAAEEPLPEPLAALLARLAEEERRK